MTRARALELYVGRGDSPSAVARNYRAAMARARAGAAHVTELARRVRR